VYIELTKVASFCSFFHNHQRFTSGRISEGMIHLVHSHFCISFMLLLDKFVFFLNRKCVIVSKWLLFFFSSPCSCVCVFFLALFTLNCIDRIHHLQVSLSSIKVNSFHCDIKSASGRCFRRAIERCLFHARSIFPHDIGNEKRTPIFSKNTLSEFLSFAFFQARPKFFWRHRTTRSLTLSRCTRVTHLSTIFFGFSCRLPMRWESL
jgi:hypothetical protein